MISADDIVTEERPVATYAQPLSRLQVSWGAILAGALTILAVSLIVWVLSLAIILSATSPTVDSVKNAAIAAWVCSIVTTLIGAFVGGMVAGYLPGNPRRVITMAHGFLAWALAFLVSAVVQWSVLSGAARTATEALATTTSAAVQSAGSAVGAAAGAPALLDQRAASLLQSLGYSPAEATQLVNSARSSLQQILRGTGPQAESARQTAAQATEQVRGALDTVLKWVAAYAWIWWATWIVAGGLSVLGAWMIVDRTRRVPERELAIGSEPLHVTTFRPARTTT